MDKQYSIEFRYHGLQQANSEASNMPNDLSLASQHDAVPCGVAIILHHDNRWLLGRRKKLPMMGSWQLPGGWLRMNESIDQCIDRVLAGFSGLEIDERRFHSYTDNHFDTGQRSISLYFSFACRDPLKLRFESNPECSNWAWFDCNDLPTDLFLPLRQLMENFEWRDVADL